MCILKVLQSNVYLKGVTILCVNKLTKDLK